MSDVVHTGRCHLEEGDGGALVNSETGRLCAPKDACVEKGATHAYHADAHRAAKKERHEFLTTALRLPAQGH